MPEPFSIVVPCRGTPREVRRAHEAVAAMVSLGPDEIVFALDDDTPQEMEDRIREACKRAGYGGCRVLRLAPDKDWSFRMAGAIYRAYRAAAHDRILCCDIDVAVTRGVLRGLGIIGRDNVALCSFTKRYPINGPGRLLRYAAYRVNVRRKAWTFSGVYWIWRPWYYENVESRKFMQIRNGVDTFLIDAIRSRGAHRIVTRKEVGAVSWDKTSEDYDWAQFKLGVWYGARNAGLLYVLAVSVLYWHPRVLSGFRWARRNPDAPASRAAASSTLPEWKCMGSLPVQGIRDWKDAGRTGYRAG